MEILNELLKHPTIIAMILGIILCTLGIVFYSVVKGKKTSVKTIVGEVTVGGNTDTGSSETRAIESSNTSSSDGANNVNTDININVNTNTLPSALPVPSNESITPPPSSTTTNPVLLTEGKEKLNSIMEGSIDDIIELRNRFAEENRKAQESALSRALETIILSYTNGLDDDNIKRANLLELYLERDFNSIMGSELDKIKSTTDSGIFEKEEIQQNIQQYTDDILRHLHRVTTRFDLIDNKSEISALLSKNKNTIRDSLEDIVKQFISLNEKERSEKLSILNKQKEKISQELESLLGRR
jgi:hypothetical protein